MNAQKRKAVAPPDQPDLAFDLTQEIDSTFDALLAHGREPTLTQGDFVDCDLEPRPQRNSSGR